jgi:RNA polymerase sigma-70 factor (ECF subfamily)
MGVDVEDLYRRLGPMVYRRCLFLLRDAALAEDAMHDVFVNVVRRSDTLHDDAPASLLWKTATHVCLNRLRSQKRKPEGGADLLDTIAASDDLEGAALTRRLLDRIFDREPVSTRAIAVMFWVDGMTHEEVAREVGLSVSGVRKRLRTLQGRVAAWKDLS